MNRVSKKKFNKITSVISGACFIGAFVLLVLLVLMSFSGVQKYLSELQLYFNAVQQFIAGLDKFAAVFTVLFLFLVRSFIPIIPFSVLFAGSALVLSMPVAVTVNVIGFLIFISAKFQWGRRFGCGKTLAAFMKLGKVNGVNNSKVLKRPFTLIILRLVPFVPVGFVSRLYGSGDLQQKKFLVFSLLGFLPRLISWSVFGSNITQPFTPGFIVPVIVLLIISGLSLMIFDSIFGKDVNYEKNRD